MLRVQVLVVFEAKARGYEVGFEILFLVSVYKGPF